MCKENVQGLKMQNIEENKEMSWHFRDMKEEDVSEIVCIEQDLFTDAWSMASFSDTLGLKHVHFLVATDIEDKIAGYCGSYRSLDEAEIVNVAVRRDCQNRGLGKAMLLQLIKEERMAGIEKFFLEVRESNASARYVYKSLGFGEIGIRRRFYDEPVEDAVLMVFFAKEQ